MHVPWISTPDGISWETTTERRVLMTAAGIRTIGGDGFGQSFAWSRIEDLRIRLPYSRLTTWYVTATLSVAGPKPFLHSTRDVEFEFGYGAPIIRWNLGRPRCYSWRLDFVLEQLLDVLNQSDRLHLLGQTRTWLAVERIAYTVPGRSARLRYADFGPLNRMLGGPSSLDRALESAVADLDSS